MMENNNSYCDLHVHTTASDGIYTPSEIVSMAKVKKLRAIAITDHDTIDGCEEAISMGHTKGVEIIPGVEISVKYDNTSIHILGLFIDTSNIALVQAMHEGIVSRNERNPRIIKKLNEIGIKISMDEVEEIAGGTIGRPHIAQVLVKKGYVKTSEEAFAKYLAKGKPAYFDRIRLLPEQAFELIINAGGIPIWAHPLIHKDFPEDIDQMITKLKNLGLKGIEVYYSDYTEEQTQISKDLAERFGLIMSGGTDFHGTKASEIELGIGKGNLAIPYNLVNQMKTSV